MDQAQGGSDGDGSGEELRVSSLELFFDVVFVFAVTQLTTLLTAEPNGAGLAKVGVIFGNIWWMYAGYAWLTNAVPPRSPTLRLLLLGGMAGYLVVGLSIPKAFGPSGIAFGAGYLVVTAVHAAMFLRSSEEGTVRAMARLGPYNLLTAVALLVAGLLSGGVRWGLWVAAFVLHWGSPAVLGVGQFRIRAAHFVERHGTILLIAFGESVIAVGIGLTGRDVTAGLVISALLGLVVTSALWWLYFDREDEKAERALAAAAPDRAPWLALFSFGYAFMPVIASVVVFAAGMKLAMPAFGRPAAASTAWFLAAGAGGYVASLVLLRVALGVPPGAGRLVWAALPLAGVAAGLQGSPELELAVIAAVMVTGAVTEEVLGRGGQDGAARLEGPGPEAP